MKKFLALAVVLAALAAGAALWGLTIFMAPGPAARAGTQTVVLIPGGSGLHGVTSALEEAGVIAKPGLFQWCVRVYGRPSAIKAGEYIVPSHASMRDILNILVAGHSIEHKLTVAEGLTSQMIYDLVIGDPVLVDDPGDVPPEGSLLPETYLYTRGMTRAGILGEMRKSQQAVIDKLWKKRAPNLPIKTRRQAIILASIVEKETGIPKERPHIASVFLNRLRIGMRLQSDPTIIYGITKGYPLSRRIRQSEIEQHTPYNTYVIAGLPPEPICNPGRDAIAAVLNPANTKDLYFVADGTGGHVFAASAAEQARNAANWHRIHDQQQ